MPNVDVENFMGEIEAAARKSLDEIIEKYVSSKVPSRSLLQQGDPAGKIVAIANKEAVDAIVISTHGYTGFRRLVSGSVTEKVVRTAECPVITIPAKEEQ